MNLNTFLLALAGLVLAPLLGGLAAGVDRVVTARLQSRLGPPLLQPFFDVGKLMSKAIAPASHWQGLFVRWALAASLASDVLLAAGGDVLMCFFVQAASASFVALGAFCGSSPYSKLGAQRELFQLLAYEPVFLVAILCMAKAAGGFDAFSIMAAQGPLLLRLPLVVPGLVFVVLVKLRKSPFDIAASHHMHQEVVRGVYTDYAGRDFALLELAHWADVTVVLWICSFLWATGPLQMLATGLAFLFAALIIDNISARLTWRTMLKRTAPLTLILATANLVWLYLE
ncbi:MAG: NADH-quinone oxidoreductase subunit H [Proteobacteria bacterium]|nr:NADH-quinone oxidoreductase subunit H [Pseudomonadota bacterium]MBU1595554.1 NADH-quinone oxidoreductase subunit H [Pseudomonadota bacterium]